MASNRNDCKWLQLSSLFSGEQINDLFHEWLGLKSLKPNIMDRWYDFMIESNIAPAHINDMWFEWLGTQGAIGDTIADREKYFWCSGIEGGGSVIPSGSYLINLPLLTDRYNTSPLGADATLDRNSPSSIIDFEGLTKAILPYEFGFNDYRRVENRVTTQDATQWFTNDGTVTDNGDGSYRLTNTGGTSADVIYLAQGLMGDVRTSIELKAVNITGEVHVYSCQGFANEAVNISNSWARYATDDVGIATGTNDASGVWLEMPGDSVDVRANQIEIVTNQSNQNPSDFVWLNDSACSEMDIPVRYYATENGNTVDANGVVTEAIGAAIPEGRGLQVWEESENLVEYSNDLTQQIGAESSITRTDFQTLTINAANGSSYLSSIGNTILGETYTGSVTVLGGTCTQVIGIRITSSAGGTDAVATVDMSAVTFPFKVELPVTFSVEGTIQFGADNRGSIVSGADASTGTVLMTDWQVENKPYATPLILTSGAAATRLADNVQTEWPAGLVNDFVVAYDAYHGLATNAFSTSFRAGSTEANKIEFYNSASTTIILNKVADSLSAQLQLVNVFIDSEVGIKYRASASQGCDGWRDNVKGVNNGDTSSFSVSPDIVSIGYNLAVAGRELNGNIKNINVVSGDLTDEEVYMIGNDDPWSGMSLDFQALVNTGDVEIGTGTISTNANWDGDFLNFTVGSTATFDSANNDDADGIWTCQMISEQAIPIIDGFLSQTASTFELSDGTTTTSLPMTPGAIVTLTVIYHAGDGLMALGVNGTLTADVPYDGTLLQGILDLFRGL